jgi:2-polyprenyl-3-methyl-5-hydroxy-6-metoxy-1,4-benzoquinol methylase
MTSRLVAGWRYSLGAILQKSLYLKRYGGRTRGAPQTEGTIADGLPIPPPHLIFASCGDPRPDVYLDSGRAVAEIVRAVLKRNGIAIEDFQTILEFGCGCGRIMRRWEALSERARLYGTDCNAAAVEWCRRHLRFARFDVNPLTPPTRYAAGWFDFVYAFSVFTHLDEPLQRQWMRELARIVKPDGFIVITTHGSTYLPTLSAREQAAFRAGQLVTRRHWAMGTNICAVFHPERYVRETLARGFRVVDFAPAAAHQDLYLLSPGSRGRDLGPGARPRGGAP